MSEWVMAVYQPDDNVMMAVYQPDDMCPEPHLVSVVECVVSAVLVEDAAGVGGAQVAGQVEIIVELARPPGHAPRPRHAVGVEVGGVALAATPEKSR